MAAERLQLVKFIKKIPPSGGAPAYKLTLPHQVVHSQLLHLVDEVFELAPSADAQQSWQGSIAPRRNKERSEYTLQGWKLFAEAHKIQAGDQVAFELVQQKRMVVQVIRAADGPICRKAYGLQQKCRHPKASKAQGNSSPQQSQQYTCDDPEAPNYWMDSSFCGLRDAENLDDDWQVFIDPQLSPSEEGSTDVDAGFHAAPPLPFKGRKALKSSRSWMSETGMKPASEPSYCGFKNASSGSSYSSIALSNMVAQPESSNLMGNKANSVPTPVNDEPADLDYSPQYFTDMLTAPASSTLQGMSAPAGPDSVFQNIFDEDSSGMIPTAVPTSSPPAKCEPELDVQLGNLSNTISKLRKDAKHYQAQAMEAQQEAAHLSGALQFQQGQLERKSREALRAAMGVERCASVLASSTGEQGCDGSPSPMSQPAVHANMSKCLSTLKESLWQLLVLATNNEDPAK